METQVSDDCERFDLEIQTDKAGGSYVIGIQGLQNCQGLRQQAFLNYENSDLSLPAKENLQLWLDERHEEEAPIKDCPIKIGGPKTLCSLDLKGFEDPEDIRISVEEDNEDIENYYIPFDVNTYEEIHDDMTDYSWNIYSFSYYPAYLSTETQGPRIGQVNRMTFEYPSSPILSQPEAVPEDTICSIEERGKYCKAEEKYFCQCIQILQVPAGKTLDIILIDEGFGGNTSHTFHVHGYAVSIIGSGQFGRSVKREEIVRLDTAGMIRRNTVKRPLRKDTFVVPNKGYLILRMYTDNIGYWLWEARSTGTLIDRPPMQFVMLVGNRESLPTVPIDFPTCGHNKSPASIFEETN